MKIINKIAKHLGYKISTNNKLMQVFSEMAIPIMAKISVTGESSEKCLASGFLPVPINYYQPIPDLEEMEKRNVWNKVSPMKCIDFEPIKYIELIKTLASKYFNECDWPNEPTDNPMQFYLHNGCFSYGCAAPLHCIIRYYKPKRIIEIGSGNSSKVISNAIALNIKDGHSTHYTIIDPFANLNQNSFSNIVEIIRKPVELMDPSYFESLEGNDILFIDSSHMCKIGSDVNFEILELLPSLNIGVFIHFHDINIPYEYSKKYAINPKFRMFWNESYILQAFLICNNDFKIFLPMDYLQRNYLNDLISFFPHSTKTDFGWVSGSFWIKRISKC